MARGIASTASQAQIRRPNIDAVPHARRRAEGRSRIMTTRTYIVLAALTGLAILAAFAIQLAKS